MTGEKIAAGFLESAGLVIRDRRAKTRLGEIDIVAEDGETLVLAEVKSRTAGTAGGEAWEKVTPSKLRRICRVGEMYANSEGLGERPMRVDVIAISFEPDGHTVTHYKDVTRFTHPPRR